MVGLTQIVGDGVIPTMKGFSLSYRREKNREKLKGGSL